MAGRKVIKNTSGTKKKQSGPKPDVGKKKKHTWTTDERHMVFILFTEYNLVYDDCAALFNHHYAGGFEDDIPDGERIRDEFASRHNEGRSAMWLTTVDSGVHTLNEEQDRAAARQKIQAAAQALGITLIPRLSPEKFDLAGILPVDGNGVPVMYVPPAAAVAAAASSPPLPSALVPWVPDPNATPGKRRKHVKKSQSVSTRGKKRKRVQVESETEGDEDELEEQQSEEEEDEYTQPARRKRRLTSPIPEPSQDDDDFSQEAVIQQRPSLSPRGGRTSKKTASNIQSTHGAGPRVNLKPKEKAKQKVQEFIWRPAPGMRGKTVKMSGLTTKTSSQIKVDSNGKSQPKAREVGPGTTGDASELPHSVTTQDAITNHNERQQRGTRHEDIQEAPVEGNWNTFMHQHGFTTMQHTPPAAQQYHPFVQAYLQRMGYTTLASNWQAQRPVSAPQPHQSLSRSTLKWAAFTDRVAMVLHGRTGFQGLAPPSITPGEGIKSFSSANVVGIADDRQFRGKQDLEDDAATVDAEMEDEEMEGEEMRDEEMEDAQDGLEEEAEEDSDMQEAGYVEDDEGVIILD